MTAGCTRGSSPGATCGDRPSISFRGWAAFPQMISRKMSLCEQAPAQPAARSAANARRRRPWPCEVQGLWLVRGEWLRLESEEEQVRWLQERALPQAGALDRAEGRESSVRPVWLRTMKSLKEGWIWLSASVRVAIGARSGISGALTVPEASAALALACVPAEPRRNALCAHRRRW